MRFIVLKLFPVMIIYVLVTKMASFCLGCAITYQRKIIPNLLFLLGIIVKEDSIEPCVCINTKFPLSSVLCRTSSSLLFTTCISVVFMYLNHVSYFCVHVWFWVFFPFFFFGLFFFVWIGLVWFGLFPLNT